MRCPSCGTENSEDARFCKSCAAPQTPPAPTAPAPPMPPAMPVPPPPPRRHKQPAEDFVGLLGFAFFLAAVAVAFAQNPNLISDFGRWFHDMSTYHTIFVRPADALIVASAWFFGFMGVFEFIGGAVRWSLRWPRLRVVSRALTGAADLIFAGLLLRYADRALSGGLLITVLVAVAAAMLMIYVTLGIYWSTPRARPWASTVEPPARQ